MVDTTASKISQLDIISRSSGLGSLSASYADLLSGFNHRSLGSAIPLNTEGSGITFFTRPNLNLSYDNLTEDRMLTPLLTENASTYQRVIRAMLDPVGAGLTNGEHAGRKITSPLFDEKNAFMPLLTNGLLSLTGWPDIQLDTYESKEGVLRENWSMVDGTSKNYRTFDLQASFRNYGGDPITLLFMVWVTYMDHVYRGVMTPYLKAIVENRVDYHSRIFRFTLDPSRTRIQKYASTTGVFPIAVPIGAALNFSADNPYARDNSEEVSMAFRCHGAHYLDPILLYEFNETVQRFNPAMSDAHRASTYTKIPFEYLRLFNYKGYPRVNTDTSELEWWVDTKVYRDDVSGYASLKPVESVATSYASAPRLSPQATAVVVQDNIDPATGWADALTGMAGNTVKPPGTTLQADNSTVTGTNPLNFNDSALT